MDEQNLLEKLFSRQLISTGGKRIFQVVMFILWGFLIVLFLWTAWKNRNQIAPLLIGADYSKLGMVIIYYLLNFGATLLGWHSIVRFLDYSPHLWTNVQIYCATLGLRRLPGTVWYVGGRMVLYQNLGLSKLAVLQVSAIELIVQYVSAGILGLGLFYLLGFSLPGLLVIPILISLIIAALALCPGNFQRLFKRNDLHNTNIPFWLAMVVWMTAYSLAWIMSGLMVSQLVSIVHPVDWRETGFIIGSWTISGLISLLTFFLPTTFGAMELSLTAFLSQILPLPIAGAVALSTRLFTFLMEVLLSFIFYPLVIRFRPKNDPPI